MRRVHMWRTVTTRVGPLKADKEYPVPEDVAREVVEAGNAVYLDADEPEQATEAPAEDAARKSKRSRSTRRVVSEDVSDGAGADDE